LTSSALNLPGLNKSRPATPLLLTPCSVVLKNSYQSFKVVLPEDIGTTTDKTSAIDILLSPILTFQVENGIG